MSASNPPAGVQVRLASVDQADAIAGALREAFTEYEALYTPGGFALTTPGAAQITQRWTEGPVWAAMQGERLVGTVAAVPKGDALYVRSMAILPGARGQGIGKRLLEQVEGFAKAGGFQRMFLSTAPFLERAIHLYEGFGFTRTHQEPHDLAGTPLLTMEKVLID